MQNKYFVVCSDNSEMFGEHNRWVHGSMLYDEVLRVPLLLRYDWVIAKKSKAIHDIQNLDILPTILAYTNISQPLGLHGINLRPWIDGSQESYDRLIFSEVGGNIDFWFAPDSPIYAVRHKEWKLIHQFSDSLQSELFRPTNTSVFELNNEILDHPDIAEQLGRVLNSQFFPNQILFPLIQK